MHQIGLCSLVIAIYCEDTINSLSKCSDDIYYAITNYYHIKYFRDM